MSIVTLFITLATNPRTSKSGFRIRRLHKPVFSWSFVALRVFLQVISYKHPITFNDTGKNPKPQKSVAAVNPTWTK